MVSLGPLRRLKLELELQLGFLDFKLHFQLPPLKAKLSLHLLLCSAQFRHVLLPLAINLAPQLSFLRLKLELQLALFALKFPCQLLILEDTLGPELVLQLAPHSRSCLPPPFELRLKFLFQPQRLSVSLLLQLFNDL